MIPGFISAERAWENLNPFDGEDQCETGDCDSCMECLAAIAQDQADEYADQARKERRWGL